MNDEENAPESAYMEYWGEHKRLRDAVVDAAKAARNLGVPSYAPIRVAVDALIAFERGMSVSVTLPEGLGE